MLKFIVGIVLTVLMLGGVLFVIEPEQLTSVGLYLLAAAAVAIGFWVIVNPDRESWVVAVALVAIGGVVQYWWVSFGLWVCAFGLGLLAANIVLSLSPRRLVRAS